MMYRNPRLEAIVHDWPSGAHRTTATFKIERTARGERATRTTISPKTGQPAGLKVLTFSVQQRIVDGDDGRTYILRNCGSHISITRGDMQHEAEGAIWPRDPRFAELLKLFADPVS